MVTGPCCGDALPARSGLWSDDHVTCLITEAWLSPTQDGLLCSSFADQQSFLDLPFHRQYYPAIPEKQGKSGEMVYFSTNILDTCRGNPEQMSQMIEHDGFPSFSCQVLPLGPV